MNYHENLRKLREQRGLSQSDIASLLQTTRQQVGKWEAGIQMMGVDKYVKLAQFYRISVDELLGLTDSQT